MSLEKLRIKRIGDSLVPLLSEAVKVIDIGCGNGELGNYLKDILNIDYYGVDLIAFPSNQNINLVCGDIPYPFADKSFDISLLILTLHHFKDPEAGFAEAIRLTKSKILLLEDVPRNYLERMAMKLVDYLGNRWVSKEIPLPFNFYDDQTWKRIFEKNKLHLKSRINVYPLPFPRLNHYLYEVCL